MKAQSLPDLYRADPLGACRLALRRTAKLTRGRIEAIDKLLGLFGVEAIRGEWQNGYWCDIVATYCNTGDTYALTVMEIRGKCSFDNSRFIVSSFGNWVERNGERLGVQ